MILQDLVTRYVFEIDDEPLKKVESKLGGLISFATKMGAAATASATAIFGLAKFAADAGDEALTAAEKIGITVESLTRLQYAAKISDVEAETLSTGLKFLAKNAYETANGNKEAGEGFKKLGVDVKDASGKILPANELLLKVSDKFKDLPEGAERTAIAMKIFGRAGSELIPMLKEGSVTINELMNESDALGYTMSAKFAQDADNFNKSFDRMMFSVKGLKNLIGGALLPVIEPLLKKFTEFIVKNRDIIKTNLNIFFDALGKAISAVWFVFERLLNLTVGLVNIFGGLQNVLAGVALFFGIINAGVVIMWGAIALLLLVVEDLYTYFTDPEAETMFGSLIKGIKELWSQFEGFFNSMDGWAKILINVLLTPIRALVNAFKTAGDIIDVIKGKTSVGQAFSNYKDNMANTFMGGNTIGETVGITPSSSPATTGGNTSKAMNAQTNITNNINVGENADPLGISKSVQLGTKDGLDQSLRGAERSFNAKGGY